LEGVSGVLAAQKKPVSTRREQRAFLPRRHECNSVTISFLALDALIVSDSPPYRTYGEQPIAEISANAETAIDSEPELKRVADSFVWFSNPLPL
jgi:hypothetical protein